MTRPSRISRILRVPGKAARFAQRWARGETSWTTRHLLWAVEAPVEGETCRFGHLAVFGWAFDRSEHIRAILVEIDGEPVAVAERHLPRSDLAERFPLDPRAGSAGWGALVPLRELEERSMDLTVIAVRDRHPPAVLTRRRIRYLGMPENGAIDWPEDGSLVARGPVAIEGWVLPKSRPISRVEIFIDGVSGGPARIAVGRPDVAEALGTGRAVELHCGFQDVIDLRGVPQENDRARIEVVCTKLGGGTVALPPLDLRIEPAAEPHPPAAAAPAPRRSRSRTGDPSLLVITHDLDRGGGQLYLFELLRLLAPDVSATVVAPQPGSLLEPLEGLGFEVHLTGPYPWERPDEYRSVIDSLEAWAGGRFDVALVNTLGAFVGQDLATRLRIPSVWAIHESFDVESFWVAAYPPPGPHAEIRRHALASLDAASALVFEADATRRIFAPYVRDESRLVTMPYGVDLGAIERFRSSIDVPAARSQLGIPEDSRVLLCMGTIEPRKAQAMLVQAFAEVSDRFPDTLLVLVGARGDAHSEGLIRFLEVSELTDRVRVLPVVSDHHRWYAVADALLIPSDIESMPRSAIEAMAFELPVLASDVFGLPELITDGENGFLHPPRDLAHLVSGLVRLLSHEPGDLARIGKAAARTVHERHDSAGYADEYRRLLSALADDPMISPRAVLGR